MPTLDLGLPLSPAPSPVPRLRHQCTHTSPSCVTSSHSEDFIVSQFAQLEVDVQTRVLKRLIAASSRTVLVAAQDEIAPRLRRDPFRVFPVEISLRVLSYITDPQSLAAAAQVSRLWYLMLSDDSTWRQLCAAHHFRRLSAAGSYVHPWTNDVSHEMTHERQPSQAIEDSPEAEESNESGFEGARSESLAATENPERESLVAYTQAGMMTGTIQGPSISGSSTSTSSASRPGVIESSTNEHSRQIHIPQAGLPVESYTAPNSGLGISNGLGVNFQGPNGHGPNAQGPNAQGSNGAGLTSNSTALADLWVQSSSSLLNNEDVVRDAAPQPEAYPFRRSRRPGSRASFGAMSGPASALTGFSRFRWQEPGQHEIYQERLRPVLNHSSEEEDGNEDASVAAYYDPVACVSSPAENYRAHFAQQYALTNAWIHGGKLAARYRLPNQVDVIVTAVVMKDGYIVLALDTSRILVFSDDGKLLRSLYGHVMGVWALALSGSTLVSGGCDRDVREWDLVTGACRKILRGHSSTVRCLAMASPHIALSGGRDAVIRVWDLKNGKTLHKLLDHTGSVRRLEVVDVRGRQLAVSASYDRTAKVWDIESGQLLHTLHGHANQIYSLAVSGSRIATGSLDHTIRIWDINTGESLATLEGHSALVGQLQMRGTTLVSGGSDGAVRVWDLDQKICVHRIAAHDNTVTSLQFNNERIVTGGPDCRVQVWNTRTGEHVRQLHKPGVTTVWGVAFQDDRLLTVYSEGTAIVVELVSFVPA